MTKRLASGSRSVRKKRKGNTAYASSSLDPTDHDEKVVENVRLWNISTSGKTGRVTGSRKTLKHYSQVPPPGRPSTRKMSEGNEESADVEDTGALADSETIGVQYPKRKRVRAVKENDSVSEPPPPSLLELTDVFRQKWSSGFNTVRSSSTSCFVSMVWAMRLMAKTCAPTVQTAQGV